MPGDEGLTPGQPPPHPARVMRRTGLSKGTGRAGPPALPRLAAGSWNWYHLPAPGPSGHLYQGAWVGGGYHPAQWWGPSRTPQLGHHLKSVPAAFCTLPAGGWSWVEPTGHTHPLRPLALPYPAPQTPPVSRAPPVLKGAHRSARGRRWGLLSAQPWEGDASSRMSHPGLSFPTCLSPGGLFSKEYLLCCPASPWAAQSEKLGFRLATPHALGPGASYLGPSLWVGSPPSRPYSCPPQPLSWALIPAP